MHSGEGGGNESGRGQQPVVRPPEYRPSSRSSDQQLETNKRSEYFCIIRNLKLINVFDLTATLFFCFIENQFPTSVSTIFHIRCIIVVIQINFNTPFSRKKREAVVNIVAQYRRSVLFLLT